MDNNPSPPKNLLKTRAMGKSEEEIYEKMLERSLDYLMESKMVRIRCLEGSTPLIPGDDENESNNRGQDWL